MKAELVDLLDEHYDFLFAYLLKLTLHPAEAEDVAQDTMVRCMERFYLFDERRAKFSTWMIQIATNLWLDRKRREKREREYLNRQQLAWRLGEGVGLEVADALSKLADLHRVPVVLKYYYGYSYEEIAQICGISVGTVKSRLHYALEKLRKELTDDDKGRSYGKKAD